MSLSLLKIARQRVCSRSIVSESLPLVRRFNQTFANQDRLPRLPVPSLENMSKKYIDSVKPLLNEKMLQNEKQLVDEFVSKDGMGPVLQQRLVEYDTKQPNSWLEDIWLEKAYLMWRMPSMINVNWWCQFTDHPNHPKDLLVKPPPKGVFSAFQVQRAAGLISSMLKFKRMLETGKIPPEEFKGTPMCMNQYKYLFGVTRVPGEKVDSLKSSFPSKAKHILVLVRNQVYKVDVCDDKGRPLDVDEIERLLLAVTGNMLESQPELPVNLLTAGDRDIWYSVYDKLSKSSPKNMENFDVIQSALFSVALDDHSYPKNLDVSHHQIFHNQGQNRWFDCGLSLIISNNGKAGVNGEHSPCDAVVPGRLMDYIVMQEPVPREEKNQTKVLQPVQKLTWDFKPEDAEFFDSQITKSQEEVIALAQDTESCLLQTDLYGARFMKDIAQTSPDAFVQIALQLAYWRLHKTTTAVYESASTRFFKHGRTETGRSSSSASWEFGRAFDNDNILYDDKRDLWIKATKTQNNYMKEAAQGKGIDRHLLGLQCMLETPEEQEKAKLFDTVGFKESRHFRLSTSNMSPGDNFWGGFGPVVADGYGINYAIGKDSLKFSISSKKSCPKTDSYKFRATLERVLKDLMILFPKRSEVWGLDWKEKHAQEAKEKYLLKRMRELTSRKV